MTMADLQKALITKNAEYKSAVAALQANTLVEGANITIPEREYNAVQSIRGEMEQIKSILGAEQFGGAMDAFLNNPVNDTAAFGALRGGGEAKSYGQRFVESGEFKSMIAAGEDRMVTPFRIQGEDLTGYGQKDVYGAMGSGNVSMGVGTVVQSDPFLPRAQLRTRVRDLFNVMRTSANLITYIRSTGFTQAGGRGAAAPVADRRSDNTAFGTKPKSDLALSIENAPVATIAHYELAHRNILDDIPQLEGTIDNELIYGLKLAEDDQLLNGDGVGANMRGLLKTPGIQAFGAPAVGDTNADVLRRAATKVMLANYPASAYVLHPNDWETTELTKASGDGQYVLVSNVAIGAQKQVWRLPVVETPAITEGTFLAGAFNLGAQLYDRQDANIRISDQHANLFIQNGLAILAEERLALAVKRPEAFVTGQFA